MTTNTDTNSTPNPYAWNLAPLDLGAMMDAALFRAGYTPRCDGSWVAPTLPEDVEDVDPDGDDLWNDCDPDDYDGPCDCGCHPARVLGGVHLDGTACCDCWVCDCGCHTAGVPGGVLRDGSPCCDCWPGM